MKAGSPGPLCFGNNWHRWLLDFHCCDSVRSDQIMFTINRSEVTRRYEVGNEHMACQDISGNDVMIILVVYFMVLALSLFIILMIAVQGWCVNKVWSWNLDWVNSKSVRTVLNKDLWKEVTDIKWELKSLPISKRTIGLSCTVVAHSFKPQWPQWFVLLSEFQYFIYIHHNCLFLPRITFTVGHSWTFLTTQLHYSAHAVLHLKVLG